MQPAKESYGAAKAEPERLTEGHKKVPAQPAVPVVPIGGHTLRIVSFLFYRAREHKTICRASHIEAFLGTTTRSKKPARRFRVPQPLLRWGYGSPLRGVAAILKAFMASKIMRSRKGTFFMQRAPKISVFPSKVLQSGNMIRLPVGVAYPAHTGGTPIASLIQRPVVWTQHANLSHDTITQFTAEKFDEVSMHQAQLSRQAVESHWTSTMEFSKLMGRCAAISGPTSSAPASQHARDCHGLFPAARTDQSADVPPRGLGSRDSLQDRYSHP